MKKYKLPVILIFPFVFLAFTGIISDQYKWETFTYYGEVNDIKLVGQNLWSATDGGVYTYNFSSGEYITFSNTDGLPEITNKAIAVDENNKVWIASKNGVISIFGDDSGLEEIIRIDPGEIRINVMVFHENYLYLGADKGIIKYSIERREVNSVFRNLGSFTPNIEVFDLLIENDNIWAATGSGAAAASLLSPNLQDPQFWRNFSTASGLPDNEVLCLEYFSSNIFIGSKKGLSVYDKSTDAVTVDSRFSSREVFDILSHDSELVFATSEGNYVLNGNDLAYFEGPWYAKKICFSSTFGYFFATGNNGVHRKNGSDWTIILPNGPGGNAFGEITKDDSGKLWVASGGGGNRGIYSWNGISWTNYLTQDGLVSNNFFSVAVDPQNRKWFGTPGAGLMIIDDNTGFEVIHINETDGKLTGSDSPSFVVVGDIYKDSAGNMWVVNSFANNGNALIAVTPENEWYYFSTGDGLSSTIINKIVVSNNEVWIGTREEGVDVLNFGESPASKSDDTWRHYSSGNSLLSSNQITEMAVDNDNYIWIASGDGLFYWNGSQLKAMNGLLDKNVNSISVDGINNKWIGTNSGISILDRENYQWTHLNTGNSPLVDDKVTSIYIDKSEGIVYAGTALGLSVIQSPYGLKENDNTELEAYPNPFIPDGSSSSLTITGISVASTVKIFTPGGVLVKELREEEGNVIGTRAYWDGKDKNGNYVPSGIYVIISHSYDSVIKRGKAALIRR